MVKKKVTADAYPTRNEEKALLYKYTPIVSVLLNGPPPVNVIIKFIEPKEPKKDSMNKIKSKLRIKGKVIYLNDWRELAPSIEAASYKSGGIPCNEANITSI